MAELVPQRSDRALTSACDVVDGYSRGGGQLRAHHGCPALPRRGRQSSVSPRHTIGKMAMERKLTTVLAVDIVGYFALMERDEAGTYERLKAGRKELFEPEIARHHGRVFKLMGDGMLAEFGSVVDAVECAVSPQREVAERNAEVPGD